MTPTDHDCGMTEEFDIEEAKSGLDDVLLLKKELEELRDSR